ncbi:MAG: hypothetical protein ACJ70U_09810 [Nitrososphaera sp.]
MAVVRKTSFTDASIFSSFAGFGIMRADSFLMILVGATEEE